MRDLLRTEVLIAALLASSFTMVGVVALWAARWPRHWFMRASVVVAFLSPLLLIPAYELFLIFALQAGVVAAGARLWPSRRIATDSIMPASSTTGPEIPTRTASLQFSLVSLSREFIGGVSSDHD
jgi:hypothetical protein